MPKFIKVKGYNNDHGYVDVYIACNRIVGFETINDDERFNSCLKVKGKSDAIFCKETPVEILKLIAEVED